MTEKDALDLIGFIAMGRRRVTFNGLMFQVDNMDITRVPRFGDSFGYVDESGQEPHKLAPMPVDTVVTVKLSSVHAVSDYSAPAKLEFSGSALFIGGLLESALIKRG